METDWKRIDEEQAQRFEKDMDDAMKRSAVDRVFFAAGRQAKRNAEENDLLPIRNEFGEHEYAVQQGLKAACHGREDTTAVLLLQRDLLLRLDRNRNLTWLAIMLLFYIAYRLS